jgi:glycosyltransferase involved in cell wall biosynthesis
MKISIVTISFNQAPYLRQCIESVLTQDYKDLEYILVDPGSTDGSREIIETYGARITPVFSSDRGPADGLNKGFARATADILGYLNADDMYLPHAVARVAEIFSKDPCADVLYGNAIMVNSSGAPVQRMYSSRWTARRYAYGAAYAVQPATFIRRRAYLATDGFNSKNNTCWDAELLVDMALAGVRFVQVDDFLAAFRLHEQSITGSGRLAKENKQDRQRLIERILGRRARSYDVLWRYWYRALKLFEDPRATFDKVRLRVRARGF